MKKILILIGLLAGMQATQAQTGKVKAKDLDGKWRMHIDIPEEAFEPDDDEDNAFARVILQATGNLVEGILENIDIEIEFYEDHTCRIGVDVFGSDDVEYTKWYIDKSGKLYIEDSESFSIDNDDYWLFDDGALVAFDQDGDRMDDDDASIYLLRTER